MFWFSSHHGAVFRSFHYSLYLWRFIGNNHLTSATKYRKVNRFMRGKKCMKIKIKEYACEFFYAQRPFYYRKVPKAKILLFSDLSPFSYSYFRRINTFGWLRRVLQMGTSKNLIAKNVKGNEPNNLTTISEMTKKFLPKQELSSTTVSRVLF